MLSQHHRLQAGPRSVTPTSSARKHKFLDRWLHDPRFMNWVEPVDGDESKFYCSFCDSSYVCSSGESNVLHHAKSNGHVKKTEQFGLPNAEDIAPELVHLSKDTFKKRISEAEIQFVDMMSQHQIPFSAVPAILNFFQNMDPLVVKNMKVGETKASHIVRNVVAPTELDQVTGILQRTKFSVYVDETTDPNGYYKWMSFTIRYVDEESFKVKDRFVQFIQLDATDCSAASMYQKFQEFLEKRDIPIGNILSLACDNASVMIGKNSFKKLFTSENESAMVIPCICHRLNLCAQHSFDTIPGLDSFLQSLVHCITGTAKQAASFAQYAYSYQASSLRILPYSKTRWLSRFLCIERIRILYPSLQAYFTYRNFSEHNQEKIAQIKDALFSDSMQAYLAFCEYVLHEFNRFNASFQSGQTMIHLLSQECERFMKWLARHFLKRQLIQYVGNPEHTIDFEHSSNQKSIDQVYLGLECTDILSRLNDDAVITEVRQNCLNFFVKASKECSKQLKIYFDSAYKNLSIFEAQGAIIMRIVKKVPPLYGSMLLVSFRFKTSTKLSSRQNGKLCTMIYRKTQVLQT